MSLDALLGTIRSRVITGPLAVAGDLYAGGAGTAKPLTGLFSAASEQVQALQAQGVLEGRRATLMLDAAQVLTAISRTLQTGDEWRVASGDYAGVWTVEAANPVRGGWQRADVKWERLAVLTSAQEQR
ncbi:MAG: hypothetical protein RL456_3457 [Pseudomonadota bacterium]|jgi:hypothetical protein